VPEVPEDERVPGVDLIRRRRLSLGPGNAKLPGMKTILLALAAPLTLAVVACAHEQPAVSSTASSTTPASMQPGVTSMQSNGTTTGNADVRYPEDEASLAGRLATARCDQREHCNEVGTGQRFTTLYDCVAQVRTGISSELGRDGCHGVLSSTGVNDCMSAIVADPCNETSDDLGHLQQCRGAAVCMTSR